MDSCEIAVRFAGTLLHVTQIAHGKSFRIGTAADVDLPLDIAPLTSFPLVDSTPDGFVVRCPAGVPAVEYTESSSSERLAIVVTESELALARGSRIDIAFERVMISIARIAPARVPLPRPRVDKRPHIFGAVSLALHLVMLLVATSFADLPEATIPATILAPHQQPVRIARHPSEEQKDVARRMARHRAKVAARAEAAAVVARVEQELPDPKARAVAGARRAGILGSKKLDDLSALTGTVDIAEALRDVGPIYDPDAIYTFGTSRRFDPTKDPAFDSVKWCEPIECLRDVKPTNCSCSGAEHAAKPAGL